MNNYIVLNGVSSRSKKGLLISTLPPITKPLMRSSIEEIDGRDGDIVTKLGYSAYNRLVTIGLFGDYNLDDIMTFFDSEGIAIFSNEPDRYYKYQIIQQIDYEKLLRFKTAKVMFHVQPFKYSAVEETFEYIKTEENPRSFTLYNRGNTISKPVITLWGMHGATISINGLEVLTVQLDGVDPDYITIDAENMEAYKGNTLKNRSVIGDYDKVVFQPGINTFSWSSSFLEDFTKVEIKNYSRWL